MKAGKLYVVSQVMGLAKMDKMTPADKGKLFRAMMACNKAVEEIAKAQEEAEKRIKPARLSELEERKDKLSADETKELEALKAEHNEAREAALNGFADKEVSPEFERLSEETFLAMLDGSSLNLAQAAILHEVLVEVIVKEA